MNVSEIMAAPSKCGYTKLVLTIDSDAIRNCLHIRGLYATCKIDQNNCVKGNANDSPDLDHSFCSQSKLVIRWKEANSVFTTFTFVKNIFIAEYNN